MNVSLMEESYATKSIGINQRELIYGTQRELGLLEEG